jgi:hypothetical protein
MPRRFKTILCAVLPLGVAMCVPRQSRAVPLKPQSTQPAHQTTPKPPATKSVIYVNKKYGFSFSLPTTWNGYSIVVGQWRGTRENEQQQSMMKPEVGPLISIRNPLWTEADPHQDIPIMIFTLAQWSLVERDRLSVSAAPIGPSEIHRNSKYVFALPPRFEYAFPTGWEEVIQILKRAPLHPF